MIYVLHDHVADLQHLSGTIFFTVCRDGTLETLLQSAQAFYKGRLSCTVMSDHSRYRAYGYVKAINIQGCFIAIAVTEVIEMQDFSTDLLTVCSKESTG